MALQVTREADASVQLLPEGWKWIQEGPPTLGAKQNVWKWGMLGIDTRFPGVKGRLTRYKSLCEVALKYEVEIRMVVRHDRPPRVPSAVYIKPLSKGMLKQTADILGCDNTYGAYLRMNTTNGENTWLNVHGWTTASGKHFPAGEMMHTEGLNAAGTHIYCTECFQFRYMMVEAPDGSWRCSQCVRYCPYETYNDDPDFRGDRYTYCNKVVWNAHSRGCEEHYPTTACAVCAKEHEAAQMKPYKGGMLCAVCKQQVCERCDGPGAKHSMMDRGEQYRVCPECKDAVRKLFEGDSNEEIVLEKPCGLGIDAHPHRPIRYVSIELEVNAGGGVIIDRLYRDKLTKHDERLQYHHGATPGEFCYIERDGSLAGDGAEVIFPKMLLNNPEVADKLKRAIGVIRKAVKDKDATIDLYCGAHWHVDAHKMGSKQVRNAVVVANYLEDPIYRMAAANYNRHRGLKYAIPIPKDQMDDVAAFEQYFWRRNEHHSVVSTQGYKQAVAHCACGMLKEEPEKCKCNLGKCTIEFRVFNGTSSPKKIHAYTALCLSIVGFANACDNLSPKVLIPQEFKPLVPVTSEIEEGWKERLTWMFRNLYFTDAERDSLVYTIKRSQMRSLGNRVIDDLAVEKYIGPPAANKQPSKFTDPLVEKRGRDGMPPRLRNAADRLRIWDNAMPPYDAGGAAREAQRQRVQYNAPPAQRPPARFVPENADVEEDIEL